MRRLSNPSSPPRSGATLMEVLISIMIMAIGIIGVATLFPISLMHAVKAHKLTSGTIHRYSAESILNLGKYIYQDPDQDNNQLEHGTAASAADRAYLFDPIGTSSPAPPGYGLTTGTDVFGTGTLDRYPTTPWTLPVADLIATAGDTWVEVFRGTAQGDVDPADGDGDGRGDLNVPDLGTAGVTVAAPPSAFPFTRAVMFYDDPATGRRKSIVRTVAGVNGDQLQLVLPVTPDPTLPSVVDEVRIETQDRRFTWLVTVRRGLSITSGATTQHAAEMDVAIFFNRAFTPEDETAHWANFQQGNSTVDIRWTAGQRPPLKRGSWILDANNGFWYQISDYSENGTQATITISGSVRASSPTGGGGGPDGKVILMRGIVDVYGLAPKGWTTSP